VLLLSLSGSPAASQAQDITFQKIGTKNLWITEYSQSFNLSDDLLVFENVGNKRDGLFAHAYDIAQAVLAKDKIKRRGVHHGVSYMQVLPDIVGTRVAYIGFRHDTGGWDVYVYDYSTQLEQRITNSPTIRKDAVALSENSVVWAELSVPGYYFSIYLYDLDTETTRLVTTTPAWPSSLDVDGNWIAWQDARYDAGGAGLDTDVFLFDLERNREQRISTGPPLTTAHSPSLSGELLVWADGRNNPNGNQGKTNIFLRNLVTGQQWQLTNGEHETNCSISSERIVYQDLAAHRTYDWILLDLSSENKIGLLSKNSLALKMKISNRHVAYVDPGSPGVRGAFYIATLPE
jgi:Tol biopolymer transport system component